MQRLSPYRNMGLFHDRYLSFPLLLFFLLITSSDLLSQDLTVDVDEMKRSLSISTQHFDPTDAHCLIEERCVAAEGDRKLLNFSTKIHNIGTKDFIVGIPSETDPRWNLDNCHEHSNNPNIPHPHYHFEGYAHYRLFDQQNNEVVLGYKMGFYIMDDIFCGGPSIKYPLVLSHLYSVV